MTKRSTDRESVSRIEAVKARQGEDHRVLTLSTGVKLRIKQVPVMLPTEIAMEGMRLRPKAPVMFIEALDRALRTETPRIGLWLDTSAQTPEETVDEIIRRGRDEGLVA